AQRCCSSSCWARWSGRGLLLDSRQPSNLTEVHMRRIGLAVVLAIGLALVPIAAEAQSAGQVPRIGVLGTATPSLMSMWLAAFRDGRGEQGYVAGQNIAMEYRGGEGKPGRFPGLAADLVALGVAVIVPSGPHAIRAARQATSTIPIVMAIVEDPVEQGFVTSL